MSMILVIDDSELSREMLSETITRMEHEVVCVGTLGDGLRLLSGQSGRFDVVLLDVWLPEGNSLGSVRDIHGMPGQPEVIVVTASGEANGASLAIQSGAWDYLEKGASYETLAISLDRALKYRQGRRSRSPLDRLDRSRIVGESPQIRACLELVAMAAAAQSNVLIQGETGTGKELIARTVHENSSRRNSPFVVVDCAALPEHLAESILFGHSRGAFTGADRKHEGLIAQAHGGTLFLDELGELPLALQKNLLRVLQERRYRPVGAMVERKSDFRLLAATNRDLDAMVRSGQFRNDLLFRLRTCAIRLPGLRERPLDIPLLAEAFVCRLTRENSLLKRSLSEDFLNYLATYDWPGNVRELGNAMERAILEAGDETILHARFLPPEIREHHARIVFGPPLDAPPRTDRTPARPADRQNWRTVREAAVAATARVYFPDLLEWTKGDMLQASGISGMSIPNLYTLLRRYGISTKRWPSTAQAPE